MNVVNINVDKSRKRSRFFREIQAWPLSEELNFDGWMNNFKPEEKEIASMILDFFVYYPKGMVNQMLITSVGHAGYALSKCFPNWSHADFKNRCYYSFIPGETMNVSDSGYPFIRKLRDALNIPESRFLDYKDLHDFLEDSVQPLPIILVDDFVGSGSQCYKAWCENRGGKCEKTLKELAVSRHKIVYAPLIINAQGYNVIKRYCKDLILSPAHILGEEYNLFNENCFCWQGDRIKYEAGISLILNKSKELGIPFSNGSFVNDAKGFGEQGLAIAFEHGAPDAIPAFFYWDTENWTPLLKKYYLR